MAPKMNPVNFLVIKKKKKTLGVWFRALWLYLVCALLESYRFYGLAIEFESIGLIYIDLIHNLRSEFSREGPRTT